MVVLAINAVPVAVGVAVARYRLYDIDRIINRTLVYGLLTASLTAVYFVSIILLGGVARALTGQSSDLVIAASTLGVAALFRPLRSRFQSTVDRRFYRPKYDADQTLTAFSSAARESVDIADLTSRMGQVIDTTIKPRHFSIWLREPEVRSR